MLLWSLYFSGAVLHIHDSSMADVHWLINSTYDPNCYFCHDAKGLLHFVFSDKEPSPAQGLFYVCYSVSAKMCAL